MSATTEFDPTKIEADVRKRFAADAHYHRCMGCSSSDSTNPEYKRILGNLILITLKQEFDERAKTR